MSYSATFARTKPTYARRGYEPTHEAAMAAFAKSWRRGVAPMTNHHEEPAPLPALVWAVVFTILLVAAVAIFVLVLIR
jgi:hypothetical protein